MPLKLKYSLIAVFLLIVWGLHTYDKQKAVKAAESSLIVKYQEKLTKAEQEARKHEHKLQESADRLREEKDAKIEDTNRKLAVALNELRKRPSRSTSTPKDTGDTKACTGGELYREDAEFLTREAARADRVLSERDYYYNQYESVRRTLEEATN